MYITCIIHAVCVDCYTIVRAYRYTYYIYYTYGVDEWWADGIREDGERERERNRKRE